MSRLEDRREARDGLKALAGRPPVVAALDLGAAKVTCFIMKPGGINREDRTLHTVGVGHVQSRGVRGGSIVNMDEAADAIALAVERAETVAGVRVQGVTVTTAGGQLASHRVSAQVSLGARPISDNDLSRAIAAALAQVRLPGRRPIHLLPVSWSVDAQRGVRDPRSMFGRQLGLELVVGEGAAENAGAILPLVRSRPRLMERLEALVRVDDRRWDLRMKDGGLIQLPATGEDSALIQLDQLDQKSRILELGFARIDLRDPELVAVRPREAAPPGQLAAGGA